MKYTGSLRKMHAELNEEINYNLPIGNDLVSMNELIGNEITLKYEHQILCKECGRETVKSFNQGFCYPCFKNSPAAADWIIHPELSKAHLGIEDRDLEFEKSVQLKPHVVYLSLTSGIKVGITRGTQVPTRWIDQGAVKAIKLAETPNRYLAGMIEVSLKAHMADKTNWRQMLTNIFPDVDLAEEKHKVMELLDEEYLQYVPKEDETINLNYPVLEYPVKLKSIGFDKVPEYTGKLTGIKGQYLMFANGIVLNIRKHEGYVVSLEA
jgi:hypothetical protein